MRQPSRRCPAGLRGYQTMMEVERRQRLANQARLRELSIAHKHDVRVICAHDPVELERCIQGRPL